MLIEKHRPAHDRDPPRENLPREITPWTASRIFLPPNRFAVKPVTIDRQRETRAGFVANPDSLAAA
jgi:hypothetical protein